MQRALLGLHRSLHDALLLAGSARAVGTPGGFWALAAVIR